MSRLLSILSWFLRAVAIAAPILTAWIWIDLEASHGFAFERICRTITPETVTPFERGLGAVLAVTHVMLLSYACWKLSYFFSESANGRYLSSKAVKAFKAFAIFASLHLVSLHLLYIVFSKILTGGVSVTFVSDDLKMLITVFIAFAVSIVMERGYAANSENERFL